MGRKTAKAINYTMPSKGLLDSDLESVYQQAGSLLERYERFGLAPKWKWNGLRDV